MKKIIYCIIDIIIYTYCIYSQSIIIPDGSSIYVPAGADICAGSYGNITGNIFGEGTQCNQSPVPVELSLFTAKVQDAEVSLNWRTETEVDNYGFEIERRCLPQPPPKERAFKTPLPLGKGQGDGLWEKIGFVEGHGNSNSPKNYSFTDEKPFGGSKFQYRLKQIDTDGEFDYSDIVEVEIIPAKFELYQNYPNPFNPVTTIRYQLPVVSKVVMKLYDILGSEVMTILDEKKDPSIYEVILNAGGLPSGTYIYRIITDQNIETKKILVLK
ncbi:MAG: T9SS type A sorting domain-containing protein [Ignavibacteriaceae bacterium]|nr:T9SS type A sorting domain-containing protein [Ignavibacteriaceae bacterium]